MRKKEKFRKVWSNVSMRMTQLLGHVLWVPKSASPFGPRHDKTNKMRVHPAKTQISLGGCLGWSESSLGAHSLCWVLSCRGSFIFRYIFPRINDCWSANIPTVAWIKCKNMHAFEPCHVKTCLREFPTRLDSNWPAQLQKLTLGLKFRL